MLVAASPRVAAITSWDRPASIPLHCTNQDHVVEDKASGSDDAANCDADGDEDEDRGRTHDLRTAAALSMPCQSATRPRAAPGTLSPALLERCTFYLFLFRS